MRINLCNFFMKKTIVLQQQIHKVTLWELETQFQKNKIQANLEFSENRMEIIAFTDSMISKNEMSYEKSIWICMFIFYRNIIRRTYCYLHYWQAKFKLELWSSSHNFEFNPFANPDYN